MFSLYSTAAATPANVLYCLRDHDSKNSAGRLIYDDFIGIYSIADLAPVLNRENIADV